jgi:plastocyanin
VRRAVVGAKWENNMKNLDAIRFPHVLLGLVALAVFSFPRAVEAQENWHAKVGAQTPDMGRQALAFVPNEIWIHAHDSITWTFNSDEIHTISFLVVGQIFPPFPVVALDFRLASRVSMAQRA